MMVTKGKGKKACPTCGESIAAAAVKCTLNGCDWVKVKKRKPQSKKDFARNVLLYAFNHAGAKATKVEKPTISRPTAKDFANARNNKAKLDEVHAAFDEWDIYDSTRGISKDIRDLIDEMAKEYLK